MTADDSGGGGDGISRGWLPVELWDVLELSYSEILDVLLLCGVNGDGVSHQLTACSLSDIRQREEEHAEPSVHGKVCREMSRQASERNVNRALAWCSYCFCSCAQGGAGGIFFYYLFETKQTAALAKDFLDLLIRIRNRFGFFPLFFLFLDASRCDGLGWTGLTALDWLC